MGIRLPRGRPLLLHGGQGAIALPLPSRFPRTQGLASLRILGPALISALALVGACGDGSDDEKVVLTPVPTSAPFPIVISRDLEVGENRFMLGLINQADEQPILGADLNLRFFLLDGSDPVLKSEVEPEALKITKTYTHTHDDGTVETHEAGETGGYVSQVTFEAAGEWGVEVTGTDVNGEALETVTATFNVLAESAGLDAGDPAPQSVQRVLADVADIAQIDTSQTPITEMHDKTIAQAVTSGRPTVVVFASPSFCTSQICGPTKDVVDDLYATYGGQANFVHVEPYDIEKARAGESLTPVPLLTDDWGLSSEPWVFVVDAQGIIAAKFDGIASYEEMEAALAAVLG